MPILGQLLQAFNSHSVLLLANYKGGTTKMCYEDPTQPYVLPLGLHRTAENILVMTYSLLLGKVTQLRDGQHISYMGFTYPIGRTVPDPNAQVGDHNYGLHFTASPASAHRLPSYSSHRLAVLPAPQMWKSLEDGGDIDRCWHSNGATTLFCLDCENIDLDVLSNVDFWRYLLKNPGKER
jgi:hypothetical protein